jgi:type II secretory pathway pseudopilin PulG
LPATFVLESRGGGDQLPVVRKRRCSGRHGKTTMRTPLPKGYAVYPGLERIALCRLAGKTLFELVVVLGILAIIIGLFLPVIQMALKAVDRLK